MIPLSAGDRAPDFSARDTTGETLALSSLSNPVALVFLRYLGCPICRDATSQLSERYLEMASRGVDLWVFVPTRDAATREYRQQQKLPFRLFSDPERQLYRLFGVDEDRFLSGTLRALSSQSLLTAARLTLKHGHGLPEGSERQRMGAFLIDDEGIVRYAYVASSTLEEIPLQELMRAIDALPPRRLMGIE